MVSDKEAIRLSRVHSCYSNYNLPISVSRLYEICVYSVLEHINSISTHTVIRLVHSMYVQVTILTIVIDVLTVRLRLDCRPNKSCVVA